MINLIENLADDKGIMNNALPVSYKGGEYLFEIAYLIDKARELSADRIEMHAERIMEAERNNDSRGFTFALQALGREIVRKGLIDKLV